MIGSKRGQTPKPPDGTVQHLSFSSFSTSLECRKQFQLSRMLRVPQAQAWWFVGGSAVHAATEVYDRMLFEHPGPTLGWSRTTLQMTWQRCFEAEIEKTEKIEPDEKKWRTSRGNWRYKEWNESGPLQVQNYIDWRRRSPYQIWTTPDGQPAIELDIGGYLPGCGMEIKAYLDRVFYDPILRTVQVIDLKSGATKPKNALQFGVYRALMEIKYGVVADIGAALMTREGALHKAYSLAKYTPEYVGSQLGCLERDIKSRSFPANVGGACFMCSVKDSCYAADGPLAGKYDPDHPDMKVPF